MGDDCYLSGVSFLFVGDNNVVEFGKNVIVNASKQQRSVVNAVDGHTVSIGDETLIANSVEIHTSDYHGIYNKSGKRINEEQNVYIGNHVWIGMRAIVLKGSRIADGCVIGAGSIVQGEHSKCNYVVAGIPAKEKYGEIQWSRLRNDFLG